MPGSHSPVEGKRFIGDKKTKVFHDSYYKVNVADTDGCQVDNLPPDGIQTFDPDTPLEAVLRGFAPCSECLWATPSRNG